MLRLALLGHTGYPFRLDLEVAYQLSGEAGLTVSVTARNAGTRPAPYGTGSHPYLTAGAPAVDGCELTLPVSQWLPADRRGIPSGPPSDVAGTQFDFRAARPIGAVALDHAFTGLERDEAGLAWARLTSDGAGAALWAGPGYRWLQVFTGDTLGPERPPPRGGHRADDLPAERVRHRHRPAHPGTWPDRHAPLGHPGHRRGGLAAQGPAAPGPASRAPTLARSSGVSTSSGRPMSPHSTSVTRPGWARR